MQSIKRIAGLTFKTLATLAIFLVLTLPLAWLSQLARNLGLGFFLKLGAYTILSVVSLGLAALVALVIRGNYRHFVKKQDEDAWTLLSWAVIFITIMALTGFGELSQSDPAQFGNSPDTVHVGGELHAADWASPGSDNTPGGCFGGC